MTSEPSGLHMRVVTVDLSQNVNVLLNMAGAMAALIMFLYGATNMLFASMVFKG